MKQANWQQKGLKNSNLVEMNNFNQYIDRIE